MFTKNNTNYAHVIESVHKSKATEPTKPPATHNSLSLKMPSGGILGIRKKGAGRCWASTDLLSAERGTNDISPLLPVIQFKVQVVKSHERSLLTQ